MQLTQYDIQTLTQAKHYIQTRIFYRITIKEVCHHCNTGESKLTKSFKFAFQKTMMDYHLCITMEYALALLQEGKQVKEVAILLGYTTPENFSRAFKKVFVNPPVSIMLQK